MIAVEGRKGISTAIPSGVGIMPEVLEDPTGPLGDRVRNGIPGSSIASQQKPESESKHIVDPKESDGQQCY